MFDHRVGGDVTGAAKVLEKGVSEEVLKKKLVKLR